MLFATTAGRTDFTRDGHVVEEGPHGDLVQIEHGLYRKLYEIQETKAREAAEAAALALKEAEAEGRKLR